MSSSKAPNPQCQHPDKYEISTDGDPVPALPYPSRLGFLHIAECGAVIHYVEINKKLCRSCCDLLVPNGEYLVWSVLAGTSAANVVAKLATLPPGDGHFPPIIQAGSELKDASRSLALPFPDIPGAKQAWEWLEAQAKPFYIDQLHMVPGQRMSPLARKRAAKDSLVALRYGQAFSLDGSRPAPKASTVQATPAAADTQDIADSTLSVKEKTKSKKSSTKKSDEEKTEEKKSSTKKKSGEKSEEKKASSKKKPDEENSEEKKAEKKKSGEKASTEKAKKEKKDKQPAQTTEITTFPEISSAKPQASTSSTVLLETTGTDSEATIKTRKILSTNSVEVPPSLSTTGLQSTPGLAAESKPLIPSLGVAPTASPALGDTKAAKTGAHTASVSITTATTLSRSWGWSEPFEFTTAPKKVPALSDYERVAESRAPSQSIAKEMDSFLEGHLKLDAPRKLLGPGDFKPISHSISGGASSSPSKRSTLLHATEHESVGSNVHGKESSMKKTKKDLDEKVKPKKLAGDSANSVSSDIAKPAKSPEKASGSKSNASGKTGHPDIAPSIKASPGKTSEQSKPKPHKDAPSTGSHRSDKKTMSSDHSSHQKKSVTSSKEIHEKEVKMKTTSSGPGALSGLGKAAANYLGHKLNEATEKKPKKDKVHEDKPPKPHEKTDEKKKEEKKPDKEKPEENKPEDHKPDENKPEEKPPGHSQGDQPEDNESEPVAPTGENPPLPSQSTSGQQQNQLHVDPEVDGPVASTLPGANGTQLGELGAPNLSLSVDNPGQDSVQDQAGPPVQTYSPAQTDAPVLPTGAIGPTQPVQSAAPYGMPETGPFAESNASIQAIAQGGWGQDTLSQLPPQGGGPTSYPPITVSMNTTANPAAAAGEPAVQISTAQPEALYSGQYETSTGSPTPPNGLGIYGPGGQSMRPSDTPGGNQYGTDGLAEGKPPSNLPDLQVPAEGPSSGNNKITGSMSTLPAQGPIQAPGTPSNPSKVGISDALANPGVTVPQKVGPQVLPEPANPATGTKSSGLPPPTQSDGPVESPVETGDKSLRTDAHPGLETTSKTEPLDSKQKSQPKGLESPTGHSPTKDFEAGADPGMRHQDHKMPHKPKRAHSKKLGGQKGHEKPGHASDADKAGLKKPHASKRPSKGGIAAGVVAGVAVGATLASLAGDSGSDGSSASDSDQESNNSDVHGDDHDPISEDENGVEPESDGNESSHEAAASEHSQSDDSGQSSDDGLGDGEDHSDVDGSDGDEDPVSDKENSLETDDDSSNGGSDNEAEDDDDDGSSVGASSGSDDSGDESDREGDESEDDQSEAQSSDDESEESDGDTPAGDTSDSDGNANSDEDHDDPSSGGEDNSSGEEDDDEEEDTEQDGSSDGDGSEPDAGDFSDDGNSSGED